MSEKFGGLRDRCPVVHPAPEALIKVSHDSTAKYYQNDKERLQKRACERYQSLFKVEKEKKHQCSRERYKNPPEDEKQKLLSIEKNITK